MYDPIIPAELDVLIPIYVTIIMIKVFIISTSLK